MSNTEEIYVVYELREVSFIRVYVERLRGSHSVIYFADITWNPFPWTTREQMR